jgi:hypothetical protein
MADKQALTRQISDLINQAQKLVYEAESIADEHGLSFTVDFGTYGMGGSYTGAAAIDEEDREYYGIEEGEGRWNASSQSC